MSKKSIPNWGKQQTGLSLIELMVGLVIGLLAMLVILQMYQVFEGQKRSTTTGGDAQENGLFALTTLERDAKMAGYGLTTQQTLGCTTYFTSKDTGSGPAPIADFSTTPITITDGGSAPDTVIMRKSTSLVGGAPGSLRGPKPQTSAELDVNSILGFAENDLVLIVQNGNCMLVKLTQVQTSLKLQHNPGGNPSTTNPSYNPSGNCYQTGQPCATWPAYTTGALVYAIGDINIKRYSVSSAPSLQLVENDDAAIPLATQIVNLQAQYGIADVGSQVVNDWVDATGGTWATPSAANILRIKSVRIAVVARSTQYERDVNNVTALVSPAALTLWPGKTMSLTNDERRYRYKIYQTIVPLRNVMWAGV